MKTSVGRDMVYSTSSIYTENLFDSGSFGHFVINALKPFFFPMLYYALGRSPSLHPRFLTFSGVAMSLTDSFGISCREDKLLSEFLLHNDFAGFALSTRL